MAEGDHIPMRTQDLKPYQAVMESLVRFHGSIPKACAAIRISEDSYYRLKHGEGLVLCVARKIMDGYTAMKNQQKVAA